MDAGLSNTVSASSSSIRRQGKKGNIYVNVGDEIFEGEDVLDVEKNFSCKYDVFNC
jgi:hypothetical protein